MDSVLVVRLISMLMDVYDTRGLFSKLCYDISEQILENKSLDCFCPVDE